MSFNIDQDLLARLADKLEPAEAALCIGRVLCAFKERTEAQRAREKADVQLVITSQDRDNRRRRMELAMVLLDETQTLDLDAIAALIWPQLKSEHEIFMAGFARGTQEGLSPSPIFAPRTFGLAEQMRDTAECFAQDTHLNPSSGPWGLNTPSGGPDPTATPTPVA